MPGVETAIGVVQAGIGVAQSISGNARLKKLRGMRTAYQTPQEYFDMNAMALNAAQTGYGAQTLNYLTNQTDRSLSSSLGAATSLGADANTIADIYDRSSQSIMKIGADNELQQFAKFNKVYETTQTLANQKVAEWADKEAKLKDDMAAAAQKVAAGNANLQSGLNMAVGGIANSAKGGLFPTKSLNGSNAVNDFGGTGRNPITSIQRIPETQTYQNQDLIPSWYDNTNMELQYKYGGNYN